MEEWEGQEKREEEEDKRKKRRDLSNGYHCVNARQEAAFLIGRSCQEVAGTSNPPHVPACTGLLVFIGKVCHKKDRHVLLQAHKVMFLGHAAVSFFKSSFPVSDCHFKTLELI